MKKYIGTKLINAEPMTLLASEQLLGRSVGYKGELNNNGDAEGYLVEYQEQTKGSEKPYQAWSPKDVFEAAYRPIDNMTFGLAIEALKQGKKVARAGWNGKGMYLKYIRNGTWCVASLNDEPLGSISDFDPNYFLAWIGMKTADNKFVPWLASQTDVLAEDWTIVE